jgi:hypothetical protein
MMKDHLEALRTKRGSFNLKKLKPQILSPDTGKTN